MPYVQIGSTFGATIVRGMASLVHPNTGYPRLRKVLTITMGFYETGTFIVR